MGSKGSKGQSETKRLCVSEAQLKMLTTRGAKRGGIRGIKNISYHVSRGIEDPKERCSGSTYDCGGAKGPDLCWGIASSSVRYHGIYSIVCPQTL